MSQSQYIGQLHIHSDTEGMCSTLWQVCGRRTRELAGAITAWGSIAVNWSIVSGCIILSPTDSIRFNLYEGLLSDMQAVHSCRLIPDCHVQQHHVTLPW